MKHIIEKTKALQKKVDYTGQYVDSIEFLLIGVALGVLGGVWGNVVLEYLYNQFAEYYFVVLVFVTLLLLYLLSFPVKRARKMVDENLATLNEIVSEADNYYPDEKFARDPYGPESEK